MTTSPRLGITEMEETQNNRDVTHNEAVAKLEAGAMFFPSIQVLLNAPPASPVEGDVYVVGTAGSGAWSGHNENVALYYNATWHFFLPIEGMFAWDQTANSLRRYDGSDWVAFTATGASVADGDYGDITVSSSGTVWLIDVLQGAAGGDILYYDTDSPAGWRKLSAGTAGQFLQTAGAGADPLWASQAYDVPASFDTAPSAGALFHKVIIVRDVAFPANFSSSAGHVGTNPAATFDVDVKDDGVSIGTISVSTGGTFTFTTTSGTAKTVAAGSRLEFYAPANSPAESTIANFAATLRGTA